MASDSYNGVIWKTVQLAATDKGVALQNWEVALYAIRMLFCTATSTTPHEQFLPFPLSSKLKIISD